MFRRAFAVALVSLPLSTPPAVADMRLRSDSFEDGSTLPANQVMSGFGCTGANLSPALSWEGAPEGTGSFVVSAYDPDAPTGSGLWHWSVINVPAWATSLPEGAGQAGIADLPAGAVQVRNDLSQNAYSGACPPPGAGPHRYVFSVFAMPDVTLPLDANASAAMVGFYANTQALARATLTATYGRSD